ncbi:MAG: hypothetical protein H0X38_08335 [Planctomycetes bacterium]|nr:hypothetical protein [Planctomycetota bacterium]
MEHVIVSIFTALLVIFYIAFVAYVVGIVIDDLIRYTVRSEMLALEEERERLARINASSEKTSA